ncbi:hypothetical protein HDU98_003706 [Podochytrium sp. JEL0797]|nr:hypothetical protein HDU98_003706 [Podochytrium sp. JEL0797]
MTSSDDNTSVTADILQTSRPPHRSLSFESVATAGSIPAADTYPLASIRRTSSGEIHLAPKPKPILRNSAPFIPSSLVQQSLSMDDDSEDNESSSSPPMKPPPKPTSPNIRRFAEPRQPVERVLLHSMPGSAPQRPGMSRSLPRMKPLESPSALYRASLAAGESSSDVDRESNHSLRRKTPTAPRPKSYDGSSLYQSALLDQDTRRHSFAISDRLRQTPPPTSPTSSLSRPKSSFTPKSIYKNSFSDSASVHETAEILGLPSPKDVKKVMRAQKISPWAAVLAVGGSARSIHSSSAGSSWSGSERGDTLTGESGSEDSDESEEGRRMRRRVRKRRREVDLQQLADETFKRNFIANLSKAFYAYGAPVHQLEPHLTEVSKALEVNADFLLLPGIILIGFGDVGHDTKTQIVKQGSGWNMGKLAQVNALCQTVLKRLVDVHDASALLDVIIAAPDYPWWYNFITFPVISFTFAVVVFQTTWLEALVAGTLGLLCSLLFVTLSTVSFCMLPEFMAGLLCAFAAKSLQNIFYFNGLCFDPLLIVLSSVLMFLPGMQLILAVLELSTRNVICGSIRMFTALFTAGILGFGMMVGEAMVVWAPVDLPDAPVCEPASYWFAALLFIPMTVSINFTLQANRHQQGIMCLVCLVGFVMSKVLAIVPGLKDQTVPVNVVVSAAIGIAANIYARLTKDIAVGPIYAAVWIQVPGTLSVKSALGFFLSAATQTDGSGKDTSGLGGITNGSDFIGQMLSVSISLALGLFIAAMIVWPMKRPKHEYLTI